MTADPATGSGPRRPMTFNQLACGASVAPMRQEVRIERGEASLSLGFVRSGEGTVGEVRGLFSVHHAVDAGRLGDWQLRADIILGRPAILGLAPLFDERLHVSLSRGLPGGWNLVFDAGAATRGALDPAAAAERTSEFAAGISRGFRLPWSQEEHRFTMRVAEKSTANWTWGTDQRTTVASLGYAHKLDLGSIAADVAFSRAEPTAALVQNSAILKLKFQRRF